MFTDASFLTPVLFMLGAALYASIGHGGASAYLLIMVLLEFSPETLRPTALTLNVLVSGIATIQFQRTENLDYRLFWIAVSASVPLAWLGAHVQLNDHVFHILLAIILFLAALRLVRPPHRSVKAVTTKIPKLSIAVSGGIIGLISGMIGVGGGILLSPLLVLVGWASPRQAAAISAPFIFANSAAGLAGLGLAHYTPASNLPILVVCVSVGGLIGSWIGSRLQNPDRLRTALGVALLAASAKLVFTN